MTLLLNSLVEYSVKKLPRHPIISSGSLWKTLQCLMERSMTSCCSSGLWLPKNALPRINSGPRLGSDERKTKSRQGFSRIYVCFRTEFHADFSAFLSYHALVSGSRNTYFHEGCWSCHVTYLPPQEPRRYGSVNQKEFPGGPFLPLGGPALR